VQHKSSGQGQATRVQRYSSLLGRCTIPTRKNTVPRFFWRFSNHASVISLATDTLYVCGFLARCLKTSAARKLGTTWTTWTTITSLLRASTFKLGSSRRPDWTTGRWMRSTRLKAVRATGTNPIQRSIPLEETRSVPGGRTSSRKPDNVPLYVQSVGYLSSLRSIELCPSLPSFTDGTFPSFLPLLPPSFLPPFLSLLRTNSELRVVRRGNICLAFTPLLACRGPMFLPRAADEKWCTARSHDSEPAPANEGPPVPNPGTPEEPQDPSFTRRMNDHLAHEWTARLPSRL